MVFKEAFKRFATCLNWHWGSVGTSIRITRDYLRKGEITQIIIKAWWKFTTKMYKIWTCPASK